MPFAPFRRMPADAALRLRYQSPKGGRDVAQRSIEILIGRLITDEAFRIAFLQNRAETLRGFIESGHELTELEIAALSHTRQDLWVLVADQIDPRLQKASLHTRSQS
jgi:hypothetical protein